MKLFLIHKEWADYCILDNTNNIISREKYKNEIGSYKLIDNNINCIILYTHYTSNEISYKKGIASFENLQVIFFLNNFFFTFLLEFIITEYFIHHIYNFRSLVHRMVHYL